MVIRSLNSLQLINTWQAHHVGSRSYTFYSNPHDSYAHLDYIFCTTTVLANSSAAEVHVCPWSDHYMVTFSTAKIGLKPATYTWKLNDSLLTDPIIMDSLTKHMDNYFTENSLPDMPPATLWTAHKAVMRVHLINLATNKHRAKLADLRPLTRMPDHLYNHYNQSPTPEILEQINYKKRALDLLLSEDTEKALRWSKAKLLLFSNSASTMFARKLNHTVKPLHTNKLRNSAGTMVSHPNDILDIFVDYY